MAKKTVIEAQPAEAPFADFVSRVAARLMDLAVIGMLSAAIYGSYALAGALLHPPPALLLALPYLTIPLYIAYFTLLTARTGQTVGKRFMGIQVQDVPGGLPTLGMSARRAIVDFFANALRGDLIGLADYLWMLRQKDRRTLHDLAAGTTVRCVRPYPLAAHTRLATVAALVAIVVFSTAVPKAVTQSGSQALDNMAPTIRKDEYWQANRFAYRYRSPAVGDVICFRMAGQGPRPWLVGRLVGLGGDILVSRDGSVQRFPARPGGRTNAGETLIPYGCLAVLGDNRTTPTSGAFPPPLALVHSSATQSGPPPVSSQASSSAAAPSPIVIIGKEQLTGQVVGIAWPPWRMRGLR